ncbi:MAG: NTP transferase domain-containing protein [Flavobacteriales bacterium]|nr:NTP transferase domain-containing protein [Flavobacteriales bacterium]
MMQEAVILAGGKGTRLQSVIKDVPKPMAIVAERPFLTYLLEKLSKNGVQKVVLSVGYKYEVILDYFGQRYKNITIEYAVEETPLGTGGGIKLAMKKCDTPNILVLNGDTFFDVSLKDFCTFHESQNFDVSIALKQMENPSRYGTVKLEQNHISEFKEKDETLKMGHINAGVYCFKKDFFLKNTPNGSFSLEEQFLQKEVAKSGFGGYAEEAYFIDIGIPEDYQKANQYFEQIKF